MKTPVLIGITGGIGSGKSTICRIFGVLGVPVYAADDRAKWLTQHDAGLRADIIQLLGQQAYHPSGAYNRPWVASQVFGNPEKLQALNALIHPKVWQDAAQWAQRHAQHHYLLYEAALMKAAGDGNAFSAVVVVEAPEALRIKRIRGRDPHRSEQEIRDIVARQISDQERSKIANYRIINDDTQPVIEQVLALHRLLSAAY
jgi:dephospho-CoA kinase